VDNWFVIAAQSLTVTDNWQVKLCDQLFCCTDIVDGGLEAAVAGGVGAALSGASRNGLADRGPLKPFLVGC
jgi:hypothetical protein